MSDSTDGASVETLDDVTAVFSIQGPDSLRLLDGLLDTQRLSALPYFGCAEFDVAAVPCIIGRLGYTGERGFEIVLQADQGERVWYELAARIRPCGFAAADCLRIEAGFVLFANEFRLPVTESEAGLERFGGPDPTPPRYRLQCFRAECDEPPVLWRPSQGLNAPEPGTITVTSACHSTLAGGALGLGYVLSSQAGTDRAFADPTGEFREVRTAPRPFYDPAKGRPRGTWC